MSDNLQNLIPSEPSLVDAFNIKKREWMLAFQCHHLGTIQSFNATNQTASASINYKKTFYVFDETSGAYTSMLVDYPTLIDCPVICLGGKEASLTFPIAQGDECLCLFNDRDMDNWFTGGSGTATATNRLHSFSDAIILVGIRSLGNVLTGYDTSRAVLQNGNAQVGVGESLIKIANHLQSLKSVLEGLTSKIDTVLSTGTVSAAPGPVTFVGTVASFNSTIEELLE